MEVTAASLGDIAVWARAHRTGSMSPVLGDQVDLAMLKPWGLSNLSWPALTVEGTLLRLGRFQHKTGRFSGPWILYCQNARPHR